MYEWLRESYSTQSLSLALCMIKQIYKNVGGEYLPFTAMKYILANLTKMLTIKKQLSAKISCLNQV